MPSALRQRAVVGNVTAIEQSGPEELQKMFPCPLEDLPQFISVVLLCAAEDEDHLKAMISRARALRVRFECGLVRHINTMTILLLTPTSSTRVGERSYRGALG